jgi:adenylosuccinate synthase
MTRPITIIQGAMFGSEGKGAVALALAEREGITWAVRTGGINAGHTIMWNQPGSARREKVVFQQLPVASVLPTVNAVLGPGAYINEDLLIREAEISGCHDGRLWIDHGCGVHLDEYASESAATDRTKLIGATGKGCAEAVIHKIRDRGVSQPPLLFRRYCQHKWGFTDTVDMLMDYYSGGDGIMIEGTQGSLLDIHTGPYPYTSNRQTISAAWVAESGLSPALNYEVILVARTFPIRVAGNSGPMMNETTWPRLAKRINTRLADQGLDPLVSPESLARYELKLSEVKARLDGDPEKSRLWSNTHALDECTVEDRAELMKLFECTTVTHRVRRVAELSVPELALTVRKEQPAYVVMTFLNYVFPELAGMREIHREARDWLDSVSSAIGCPIRYTTTGPASEHLIGPL